MTTYQNLESKYTPQLQPSIYPESSTQKSLGNHHIFNPYDKVGIVCQTILIYICCFIFTHLYHTILSYLTNNIPSTKSKKLASRIPRNAPPTVKSTPWKNVSGFQPATETIPKAGAELYELEQFRDTSSDARTHGTDGWRGLGWLDAQAESWLANWIACNMFDDIPTDLKVVIVSIMFFPWDVSRNMFVFFKSYVFQLSSAELCDVSSPSR